MKIFDMPLDSMVVTSTYVTQRQLPIVEISHEDDGEGGSLWQFHCANGDYSMGKMQLVQLATLVHIDPSIQEVAEMKLGSVARRVEIGSTWVVESL